MPKLKDELQKSIRKVTDFVDRVECVGEHFEQRLFYVAGAMSDRRER